jgi:hypothetical protein
LVFGEGAKSELLFRGLAVLPWIVVFNGGQQKIQPIDIADLVATVKQCLSTKASHQILNVVGKIPYYYIEILQKIRHTAYLNPAKTINLSLSFGGVIPILGKALDEPAINAETWIMLQQGNAASSQPLQQFLGYSPASLDDILTPMNQSERLFSQLYFFRSLLRWSFAFLWIWTGIVSLFLYPQVDSIQLLLQVGIAEQYAPFFLYSAGGLDILIGIGLLIRWFLPWLIYFQIILILVYSLIISLFLTEFWLHPFGALSKNIILIVASFILLKMEQNK